MIIFRKRKKALLFSQVFVAKQNSFLFLDIFFDIIGKLSHKPFSIVNEILICIRMPKLHSTFKFNFTSSCFL